MKHLVLIFCATILGTGVSFGQCPAPEVAPWLETFTGTTDQPCWSQSSTTGGPWVYTGTPDFGNTTTGSSGYPIVDHTSGVPNNYAWMNYSGTDTDVTLVTPEIDVTALTVPELSFWTISHNNNGQLNVYNNLIVEASDGVGGWVQVGVVSGETGPGWVQNTFVVTPYVYGANLVQFRFIAQSGGDVWDYDNDMPLDDVEVREAPTCPQPSNLVVSNITSSTADFTFQDNSTALEWEVEWGPQGYTPGTGTSTIITSTSTTVTGMPSSSTLQISVRAICSPGDTSFWSTSAPFATACGTFPAPFIESFATSGLPLCWSQAGPTVWEYGSSATTPTGPAGWGATGTPDYSTPPTGTFIMMDGSDNTTGEVSSLTSPFIDASTLTLPMVSYAVFCNNVDDGTLNQLLVEFWDGAAWNTINIIEQNLGPNWVLFESIIDPVTITGDVQLRFTVTGGAGTPFYQDILIDDIELKEAPACPNPSGLTWTGGDASSAGFAWNPGFQETEWTLEYGPLGFTPGTGTSVVVTSNPDTLTGLPSNQFFDVYVYANCSPTDTSDAIGPVVANTFGQGEYMENDAACPPAGFIDISTTGVNMNIGYNGEAPLDPLPFDFLYQNTLITNLLVGNNGGLQLGTNTGNIGAGGNFNTLADGTLFAWGDLMDDETGDIYWQQVGTSPNSVLVIQWENLNNAFGNINSPTVTFQIQLDEATNEIFYVYDDVVFGGTNIADDFGANADIGASGPNQDITVSTNDPTYLQDNSCVRFYYTDCPRPTNYNVSYTTTNEAAITWNAGLSNETEWQVIYGFEGFNPQTNGTSVTINTGSAVVLPGLDDATVYDVYILALCANGDTSVALFGQFETLPNCADPTSLSGTTAVDSIFASWAFTANTGFPIQEFGFEYGPTGFMNGMGTTQFGVNTTPLNDTIADPNLMSGGLYDVYIQAICTTGDSSNWVGPITVTMPLTNDSTCLAQALPVDNVNYSFNGTGAGVSPGELNIAPPAGPCDGQMTWCNSSMTATTWFTFVAPASGNVRIDGEFQDFDGQVAVYETTDCADFNLYNLIGANDDFNLTGDDYPYLNLCGLTPGNTYYLVHDPNGAAGVYSLRLQEIVVEAGTDNGLLDVCLGDTVNLNTQLTGADAGGVWTEEILTAGFNDPIWASDGLASQVYTFEYMVVDGCAMDSVETSVEVYAPSFAGNDGTITACQNEPINLLSGLVGSTGVDFTGTWYDPANNALPNAEIITGSIPGQFNYDYIAGNGVCPDDTANVIVEVLIGCDFLNLQDLTFESMDIYPNPTTNVFYISNEGSTEVYNYELTDLNGKIITTQEGAINGVETAEVNVENLETGVYLIRIFNENAEKTFRVVKQ